MRKVFTFLCAVAVVVSSMAVLLPKGTRGQSPFNRWGYAYDDTGVPLEGELITAWVEGVSYGSVVTMMAPNAGLFTIDTDADHNASDNIKDGGYDGETVYYAHGDLTTGGIFFNETDVFVSGGTNMLAANLHEVSDTPALLKINNVSSQSTYAITDYIVIHNPTASSVDAGDYSISVAETAPNPITTGIIPVELSDWNDIMIPPNGYLAIDMASWGGLDAAGNSVKLIETARGFVVDRVEYGAIMNEPENSVMPNALAPAAGQEIRRNTAGLDTNDCSADYTIGSQYLPLDYSDSLHIFAIDLWATANPAPPIGAGPSLLNTAVDVDTTYTFFVEANYTIGGVEMWNDAGIELTAWWDQGVIGAASVPVDPSWSDSFETRTRQFWVTWTSAGGAVLNQPGPPPLNDEFRINSWWEDPGVYANDGHRVYINVTFEKQTYAADGSGFMNGPAFGGMFWDKNMALNDPYSWDFCYAVYDINLPSSRNESFEEFGINDAVSIMATGNPVRSAPPGAAWGSASPSSQITYSANRPYWVKVSLADDLYLNGAGPGPNIPATNVRVQNVNMQANPGNSEVSMMTSFSGPGSANALCVWGTPFMPMPTPLNGTYAYGDWGSDFNNPANFMTDLVWEASIPLVPEGTYWTTITYRIESLDGSFMQEQSTVITINVVYPHTFVIDMWDMSDPAPPLGGGSSVMNTEVDLGKTYTFYVEGNYTIGGIDQWALAPVNIDIKAWYDQGIIMGSSPPDPTWTSNATRNQQFWLSYSQAGGAVLNYPVAPINEFIIHSWWEDANTYGLPGDFKHRVYINITFIDAVPADGMGFVNGGATLGRIWDVNSAQNDPDSWDFEVGLYDSVQTAARNNTYEEFGISNNTDPDIWASPLAFGFTVPENQIDSDILTIGNNGATVLDYNITIGTGSIYQYYNDFDNESEGTSPPGGFVIDSALPIQICEVDDAQSNSNPHSMYLVRTGGAANWGYTRFLETFTDETFSVWLYFDNIADYRVIRFEDDTDDAEASSLVSMLFFDSAGDINYYDGISLLDTGYDYSVGWNRFDVIHDFSNGTYQIFLDGSKITPGPDPGFYKPTATDIRSVHFGCSNAVGTSLMWVDDISISDMQAGPGWLSVNPLSGSVTPANNQTHAVTVDATGLSPGFYEADITIESNDPDENPLIIPVNLTVTPDMTNPLMGITKSAPSAAAQGQLITYWLNYTNVGTNAAYNVWVTDTYPADVTYMSAIPLPNIGNNQWNCGNLGPNATGSIQIWVQVSPSASGNLVNFAELTYENTTGPKPPVNDTATTVVIANEPDIWVDPTHFDFVLPQNATDSDILTIGNSGLQDLYYNFSQQGGGTPIPPLFEDTFDTEAEGTSPPINWVPDTTTNYQPLYCEVDNTHSNSNPHGMLLQSPSVWYGYCHHDMASAFTDEPYYVSIYPPSTTIYGYIITQGTTGNINSGTVAVWVGLRNDGSIRYYDGVTWINTGSNYNAGTWNDFKIVHDVTTETFDLWHDGLQIVNDGDFRSPASSIMSLHFGVSSSGSPDNMWIDDVRVGDWITPPSSILFEDDFDTEAEGTSPPVNWAEDTAFPAANCEVDDVHRRSSPHSMYVRSFAGNSAFVHTVPGSFTINDQTPIYISLYMPDADGYYAFRTESDEGNQNNPAAAVQIGFDDMFGTISGIPREIIYYDGASYINTGYTWSTGTWFEIKLVHDFAANTFDAWKDGLQIVNDGDFFNNQAEVKSIHVYAVAGSHEMWVDDVRVGDAPATGSIFEDDFDTEAEGTSPPVNWIPDTQANFVPLACEVDDVHFKSAPHSWYLSSPSVWYGFAHHDLPAGFTDEPYTYSIYATTATINCFLNTQGTTGNFDNTAIAARVALWQDGSIRYWTGAWTDTGYTYTAGAWNDFKIIHDCAAGTFDCWHNGVLIIDDGAFDNPASSIKSIHMGASSSGTPDYIWIDDVKVAGAPVTGYLFEDDFDSEAEGTSPPINWVPDIGYPPDNLEVDNVHYHSSSNSMWLRKLTSGVAMCHCDLPVTFTSEKYSVWVYFSYTNKRHDIITNRAPGQYFGSNVVAQVIFDELANIQWYDGVWHDTGFDYSTGWHQIEIIHSFTGNQYDVWYDGTNILTGANFRNSASSIRSLHYSAYATGGTNSMWIDDIRVGDGSTPPPTYLFEDTFDTEAGGTSPPINWVPGSIYPPLNCEVDNVHSYSSPNSMWLRSPSGDAGTCYHDVSFTTEPFVSMLYFDSSNQRRSIVTQSVPGDLQTGGPNYLIYLQFRDTGNIHWFDGVWQDSGYSYSSGWHKVTLIHDFNNDTFDCYYDGALVIDNGAFLRTGRTSVEGVHYWNYGPSSNPCNWWIDDVRIGNAGGTASWLDVSPDSGYLMSNQTTTHMVTVNSTGLAPGFYQSNITIYSNDPDENPIIIPVNLTVLGQPLPPQVNFTKWAPAQAGPGDTIAYWLNFTNVGTETAYNITVTETYPPGVTFISSIPVPTAGDNYWYIGTLPPGASMSIQIMVMVDVGASGSLVNFAQLDYTDFTGAPRPTENATATTNVTIPPAYISITKAAPATANPGEVITYTITYQNIGSATAYNVLIIETYPVGVTYVTAVPPPTIPYNMWFVGNLAPGAGGVITINVLVDQNTTGTIMNMVEVQYDDPMGLPYPPEFAFANTTVINPMMDVTKEGPLTVCPGGTMNYWINYTNIGTDTAHNVWINDTLPPSVIYVVSIPLPTAIVPPNYCWLIASIPPGASGSIEITVVVDVNATGVLVNYAITEYNNGADIPQPPVNASATTGIVNPLMTIEKWGPPTADPGDIITYWINYSNVGTGLATDLVIMETYPPEVTYISAVPLPDIGDNVWQVGDLAPGAGGTIQVWVQINANASGDITNHVEAQYNNCAGLPETPVLDTCVTTIIPGDTLPPEHSNEFPPIDGYSIVLDPTISVHVTDISGVNVSTVKLFVQSFQVFHTAAPITDGYNVSYWHASGFTPGDVVTVRIIAKDYPGNELDFTWQFTVAYSYDIALISGWNFISFPLQPLNNSIEPLFASTAGIWDIVEFYNTSDVNDHWKSYATFKPPQLNDLHFLVRQWGFWLHVNSATTLTIYGMAVSYTEIPLMAGWNMVGYPSMVSRSVADALAGTGYDAVEGFDPGAPYHTILLNDTYMMKPGEGYWVHVNADTMWVVDW